ncbi:GNAT family N-acetyltransferase [Spongiimicrobium sp. 3-5]|uniref:GNAT family N-acetyltransferase n=1 Tax=Spongiimicrobium sp. 3-5 TaxID=3332596 RepID=UPI00397F52C0
MNEEFYIDTDQSKMDIAYIHDYLSNKSYWAKNRDLQKVKQSMEHSICFAVYNQDRQQIAFARIVTDEVVFAWLMDVFVDDTYQGKGIGKLLMEYILRHPSLKTVKGIGLRTNDAHGLYKKFGFNEIDDPETWMLKKNE